MPKPDIGPAEGGQHPLIEFKGILKDYNMITEKRQDSDRESTRVEFDFIDVEVIESREPYNFPIAKIVVGYSRRPDTVWDVLATSFRKVLPEQDIDLLVGKQQHWQYAPCSLRRPTGEKDAKGRDIWDKVPSDAWQLVECEGYGDPNSPGLNDALVDLADGKSDKEFYSAMFADRDIKKMSGFQTAMEMASERTLLTSLVAGGRLNKNSDGVYHKV